MDDSDYLLVEAIGNGDREAFERFVRLYQERVLHFIYRLLGDRQSSEDLAQEVFLRVYRSASGFEPRAKVSTWLFKIAYNLSLNEIKRRQRYRMVREALQRWSELFVREKIFGPLEANELGEQLKEALGGLPENQKAALLLKVNEGLSYLEIAGVLGVSTASVESLIFRARRTLRRRLRGEKLK